MPFDVGSWTALAQPPRDIGPVLADVAAARGKTVPL